MKTLILVLTLALPLLNVVDQNQTQLVSFNPNESELIVGSKYSKVQLVFEIESPYYIQVDQAQVANEDLIPSKISLAPSQGLSVCRIHFPKPQTSKTFGANERISVFDNKFTVEVELEAVNGILSGVFPLKGELYYQASDERQCFLPKTMIFETQVEVIMP